MKVIARATGVDDLNDLCRRAAQILVTFETRRQYPNGHDALNAPALSPPLPSTREAATPNIMLVGPFRDRPDIVGVAIYVGIGFIEITTVSGNQCAYASSVLDGDGFDARSDYLDAALRLYFYDVTFKPSVTC